MPNLKSSRVQAIKEILKLYLLKSDILNINIPKFEYHVKYNVFLKQNVVEKILQPPIKELNTSHVLFKKYNLQELKTLLYENFNHPIFNSSFSKFVLVLNFINQFFCISSTKINYCEFNFIKELSKKNFDEEYLEVFFNKEINIELNYTNEISIHDKNLDNFINLPQVSYNRFLVLYHEAFKNFDKKELTILFNACSNDNDLVKSLILCPNSLTLEQCIKNIESYIELHQTLIKAPNYQKFLILYKNLFNSKLTLNQSDLLLNACNNKDLVKSLISNRIPFTFEERFNIVTKIINKYEHDLNLIPRLIIQLLNLLSYEKVKPSIKKMDIDLLIDSLAKHDNISINWCYPDGIPFESGKYCKLLGEDFYA